jgi:hypothetical protein
MPHEENSKAMTEALRILLGKGFDCIGLAMSILLNEAKTYAVAQSMPHVTPYLGVIPHWCTATPYARHFGKDQKNRKQKIKIENSRYSCQQLMECENV